MLAKLIRSFEYSANGLMACFKEEKSFQLESVLLLGVLPLSFYLADSAAEIALLLGSYLLIMIVELINTAIERAIDRISADRHELSKEAKDMGSAAVLLSALLAAAIWLIVIFF